MIPLLALLLAACQQNLDAATTTAQNTVVPVVAAVALPAVGAVESVLPPAQDGQERPPSPLPPAPAALAQQAAVDLVIRWEIGTPARYTARYEHPICPGGSSGPTVGIGADLGTQTRAEIRRTWGWHPQVDEMVTASGQLGPSRCKAWVAAHRSIRVRYEDARRVFLDDDWPAYYAAAGRAYRNGWTGLSEWHRGGLGSVGYNRGFGFAGERRRELRVIRDTCVPAGDAQCSAAQNVASCRVWLGTPIYRGICDRRKDEARLMIR